MVYRNGIFINFVFSHLIPTKLTPMVYYSIAVKSKKADVVIHHNFAINGYQPSYCFLNNINAYVAFNLSNYNPFAHEKYITNQQRTPGQFATEATDLL